MITHSISPVRVRVPAARPNGTGTDSSQLRPVAGIDMIRLYLEHMIEDVDRARTKCDLLVWERTVQDDHDGERKALHLRVRLEGLLRQAEDAVLTVEEIVHETRRLDGAAS